METMDDLDLRECDAPPIEAPAWKNLIFLRNGKSLLGRHVFASKELAEDACAAGAREMARLVTIHPQMQVVKKETGEHLYYCHEVSHAMPIPIRLEVA